MNERTAALNGKMETFLVVFSSILTQYDMFLSAKERKRGRENIYRLGHYLNALDRLRSSVKDILQDDSKEAAQRLRAEIDEVFTPGNPADKLRKVVDAYISSGTLPKIPIQRVKSAHPVEAFKQALLVDRVASRSVLANLHGQNEKLYDTYVAKNYWGDDEVIKGRLDYAEQHADRFKQETGLDIHDPKAKKDYEEQFRSMFRAKAMKWLEEAAGKIVSRDLPWMLKSIRHDQKVMKDLFQIVTGQNIKNLSSVKLKPVLEAYAAS